MRWIIDGYNVILADLRLSKLLRNDPEAARNELSREIQHSGKLQGQKVTIIFDGKYTASTERITENLEIKFSAPRETADDLIKKEIGDQLKRRSLLVVGNDHAIINYARECGAKVVKSEDFLSRIREPKSTNNTTGELFAEKPVAADKPDLELLRLFRGKKNEK